jgi:hypothetical protein
MKVFPSMSSWVHAAKLCILAYAGVVVFTSAFWFFLLSALIAIMVGVAEFIPFLALLGVGALLAGFVFHQVARFIYWLLLRIFWSKPPKAIAPKGFKASLHSFYILTLASLPLAIVCYLPMFIDLYAEMQTTHQMVKSHDLTPAVLMWFWWLWLIAAAYLYECFPFQQQQQKQTGKRTA